MPCRFLLQTEHGDKDILHLKNQATNHIKNRHNTTAPQTFARLKNILDIVQKMLNISGPDFLDDPACFFALGISLFQIQYNIPFGAFESKVWRVIAKRLPCPSGKQLPAMNLQKQLIEHYCTIKDKISSHFAKACAAYSIPYLSVNWDCITGKINQQKYGVYD